MRPSTVLRHVVLLFAIGCLATVAAAQQVVQGALEDGSLYEFQVPANWNGELALYAHEYYDPEFFASPESVILPPAPFLPLSSSILISLRAHLLDLGYAVGYSSYASNGWANWARPDCDMYRRRPTRFSGLV